MKIFAAGLLVLFPPPLADAYRHAPVYAYIGDSVLGRISTFHYQSDVGNEVLYCIAKSKTAVEIQCVVRTPSDKLVLIDEQANGFSL